MRVLKQTCLLDPQKPGCWLVGLCLASTAVSPLLHTLRNQITSDRRQARRRVKWIARGFWIFPMFISASTNRATPGCFMLCYVLLSVVLGHC